MKTVIIAKTFVFDDKGRLLLLVRSSSDDHRPGGLDLPGGKIETGEEIVAGVLRETQEEAGLTIDPSDLHWVYADTKTAYNTELKQDTNMVRVTFAARVDNPDVKLSHEHDDFSWHPIEEAIDKVSDLRYAEILKHIMRNDIAREYWGRD